MKPKERKSKKRKEIDAYKEELKSLTYSELNREAIKIAFSLMQECPNTWQDSLRINRKHSAIFELMKAK